MVTIKIIFVAKDLKKVLSAIAKVRSAVYVRAKNIGYQLGVDYLKLVYLNIVNQRYSAGYEPYSEKYGKWKSKRGPESRFWILSGDLLQALSMWKKGKFGWVSGIPAGILDSGGKNYSGLGKPTYIGAYGRIMEYGGSFEGQVHPARPVFGPTLEEYKKSGALKRLKESRTIIKRNWR